ncbi:MAG: hypothetical protein ACOH1X_07905 [Kaistella sp.]
MKFTEKISLETVGDKKFRIKLIESENNQEAVLTHYLHSLKNKKISNFFKDDAINFTKEILEDKLGVPLKGRAFRSNLFVRSSQKGFPLQSLTQDLA